MGLVLINTLAFSQPISDFKPGSEPDGFRGLKWGTDISTLSDMEYHKTGGDIQIYVKKNDELKMGKATLEKIEYDFWRGKFYGVHIYTRGYTNWVALKNAVFKKYGKGFQGNKNIEKYDWSGKKTEMMLNYFKSSENGTFIMFSIEMEKQKMEAATRRIQHEYQIQHSK